MKNRLVLILVVLMVALGISVSFFGCKAKGDAIVIATDATWPPMEYINEDKEIVGFDIDLMNLAAKKGGFKVEFVNTGWDGIFAGLATNQYDAVMSSVTITDKRKETMDFSIPYINAGQVLIVRADTEGVTTIADLKGKSAGAQIGTTGYMEIEKVAGVEPKSFDEIGLAIEDLVNGSIHGVVADTPTAADYVMQNENYKDKLKIVGEPFTDEYYGVAVKKGNSKVLDVINAGFEKVLNTKDYEKLEDKWLR
jgi:polar amino acid transport system substrate-binding protein